MSGEAYELLAMLMRYIFVIIGIVILFRAYRWMRKDARAYQREMRTLPDAGLVGEIVDMQTGESQPLPREGVIGSARDCDIRLKYPGVKRRHALFSFEEGKGVCFVPRHRGVLMADGQQVAGRCHALHGTQLKMGDAVMRVRLFAGLDVPHPAQFAQDTMGDTNPFRPIRENGGNVAFSPPVMQEMDYFEEGPQAPMGYAGGYTEDGQMTWQFAAYPLEELRMAQAEMAMAEQEEEEVPYQSPLPRRRRRDRY